MKGLSLTLTIVIIAIVLLVTALVIMTIFGTQIGNIMSVLGIWSTDTMAINLCQQKCATWCQLNPGSSGPTDNWGSMKVRTSAGEPEEACSKIMEGEQCTCSIVKEKTP